MNVLLLSRYGTLGASSRVRFYQYLPYLLNHGIEVVVAPLLPNEYLRRRYSGHRWGLFSTLNAYLQRLAKLITSSRYRLVWIEYELLPWLPAWFESWLAMKGVTYVVDFDDAIFHRYDKHHSWWVRLTLGGKIDAVMRGASLVTVGNEYLAKRALHAGARRVEHLPTCIDLTRYAPPTAVHNSPLRIGWIGSPATSAYLNEVRPALSAVCRNGRAKVVLIGASDPGWSDVPHELVPWTEAGEVASLLALDIGIMPLPNTPWEQGKCGYKLIQYMACGKPVVASPVGVNRKIVAHGVEGFLAESSTEWITALSALVASEDLRKRFGDAGRRKIEQDYSVQVMAPRLAGWLRSLSRDKLCAA